VLAKQLSYTARPLNTSAFELERALLLLGAYPLFQEHLNSFAHFLSDRSAYLYLYRQHVPAVAHSHERTFERMTINCASNFNQATCSEKLD